MRLLEVVKKIFVVVSVVSASVGCALADVKCNVVNVSNADVVTCSHASFVKIDKVLNEQYRVLSTEIASSLKVDLLSVQKDWIRLKESYCGGIGSDASSGQERLIDKISCEKQLTSFRLSELIYLRTGVIGGGFYKAVSIVNEKTTAMDYPKAVDYVSGQFEFGPLWAEYAQRNCAMTQKLFGEVFERCIARMKFQMPIY
ncbi:lysozyme inhibitor LprI family protein [Pseudomonas sp. C2B4]|uniref:lysozyme inhibitor LprI family protein n=1 Tax=Pseudomonas sp. C2B4 TaxID=2735270 RepID=UPI00158685D8|nr:lysozyme inhibitor LprI family protein [Pseudomonas sp. C2B4]NUU38174.1 DUF1311 domain-containing protein [Pseudomonas sp. C2B4]